MEHFCFIWQVNNEECGGASGKVRLCVVSSKARQALGRVLCAIRRRWADLKAHGAGAHDAHSAVPDVPAIQVKLYNTANAIFFPDKCNNKHGNSL